MVSLLPIQGGIIVTETFETLERKSVIGAFGLLQAEDIGLCALKNRATRSIRRRTELMFQVVTLNGMRNN